MFSKQPYHLLLSSLQTPANPVALRLDSRPMPGVVGVPPAEVQLFQLGPNETKYGTLWLTEESMRYCLAGEAREGRDLAWDWEHYSEDEGPNPPTRDPAEISEAKKAAGWFSLSARGSQGIWATRPKRLPLATTGIYWTPIGYRQVSTLEYRFYSPAVLIIEDAQGRKIIVGITSCALTNSPATLNQRPLLCTAPTQGSVMNWEQQLAQLNASGASEAEINAAKAEFDAKQRATVAAGNGATVVLLSNEQLQEQLTIEKRARILLAYGNCFTPAERPSLEKIKDLDWLEEHLKSKGPIPQRGQALQLAQRQTGGAGQSGTQQTRVTDGNSPLTFNINGEPRPWHKLSYRELGVLGLADKPLFLSMRKQAKELGLAFSSRSKEDLGRPIRDVKQVLLATGVTLPGDIVEVIPEVLDVAVEAGFAGMQVFQGSPVVIVNSNLPTWNTASGRAIKNGDTLTMPYWEPIGDFAEVTDETAVPTNIQKGETTQETSSVRHFKLAVQLAYVTESFAAEGSDPIAEFVRQMTVRAGLTMEDGFIAKIVDTTLVLDASVLGAGNLSYEAFVRGLEKWGDEEFEADGKSGAMMFMHSNGLRQVRGIKDGVGMPIFADAREGGLPKVLGIPARISDRLALDDDELHGLVIAKPGCGAIWYNGSKLQVQKFHDVATDQDLNVLHLYFAAHLYKRPARRTKSGAIKIKYKAL